VLTTPSLRSTPSCWDNIGYMNLYNKCQLEIELLRLLNWHSITQMCYKLTL
jgi:hypothetical protein